MDIRWVWIWSDIHAHGYFHGRGTMRLMVLDLDLILQYPSKPAPLPSLLPSIGSAGGILVGVHVDILEIIS
jgi:hypothetical protein